MEWSNIIIALISALTGGGLWEVIKVSKEKKKTPYDMVIELLAEQKRFFAERNAEYEAEKRDSARKSYVISQSRNCEIRRLHPEMRCSVDEANDQRLLTKCEKCFEGRDDEDDNS